MIQEIMTFECRVCECTSIVQNWNEPVWNSDDVLELDEVWSCVLKKAGARWVWTAMCRRTRHIVAFAIGDREPCNMLSFMQDHPG